MKKSGFAKSIAALLKTVVFALFFAESLAADPIYYHSCTSDAHCGRLMGNWNRYSFSCCTTVVCNERYNYYLVHSGCVEARRARRDCSKIGPARRGNRFAARILISQWMPLEIRLQSNCPETKRTLGSLVGPSGVMTLSRTTRISRPLPINMRYTTIAPPTNAVLLRNFSQPYTINNFTFESSTLAPQRDARFTDPCDDLRKRRLCGTARDREKCCIHARCRGKAVQLNSVCRSTCKLTRIRRRPAEYYFRSDLWIRYRPQFIQDFGADFAPEKMCSQLTYFYSYVKRKASK